VCLLCGVDFSVIENLERNTRHRYRTREPRMTLFHFFAVVTCPVDPPSLPLLQPSKQSTTRQSSTISTRFVSLFLPYHQHPHLHLCVCTVLVLSTLSSTFLLVFVLLSWSPFSPCSYNHGLSKRIYSFVTLRSLSPVLQEGCEK
jgi:hypothetical protein